MVYQPAADALTEAVASQTKRFDDKIATAERQRRTTLSNLHRDLRTFLASPEAAKSCKRVAVFHKGWKLRDAGKPYTVGDMSGNSYTTAIPSAWLGLDGLIYDGKPTITGGRTPSATDDFALRSLFERSGFTPPT